MITFDQAYEKAQKRKPNIDNCTEYENSWVFGSTKDNQYEGGYGHTPVVILKEYGRIVSMPEFIAIGTGKEKSL